MRFSKLVGKTVRLVDLQDAQDYVGGPLLLQLMEKAEWIKPVVRRGQMVRFDVKHLDQCCDRLEKEFPEAS